MANQFRMWVKWGVKSRSGMCLSARLETSVFYLERLSKEDFVPVGRAV